MSYSYKPDYLVYDYDYRQAGDNPAFFFLLEEENVVLLLHASEKKSWDAWVRAYIV